MAVVDNRVCPLASVRLYNKGQGDPYILKHEWGWYDTVCCTENYNQGTPEYSGFLPVTETIDGLGMFLRPRINLKDTLLADYTVNGGSWSERAPAFGAPRAKRLVQYDAFPNATWQLTSNFPLPANLHIAFTVATIDTNANNNFVTHPPYWQFEFSNGTYAIRHTEEGGLQLLKNVNGTYYPVKEIETQREASVGIGGRNVTPEMMVLIRWLKGSLAISTDRGVTYTIYQETSAIALDSSTFVFKGQGGSTIFGFHQVQYVNGKWTSPQRGSVQERTAPSTTITPIGYEPQGTTLEVNDLSPSPGTYAQYEVIMAAAATDGQPFNFYTTPELYAVGFQFDVETSFPLFSYTTPWDGAILSINFQENEDLGGATATIRIRKEADVQFVADYGKRPKIKIYLGELYADGTVLFWEAFTGYIRTIVTEQSEPGKAFIEITADAVAIRAKKGKWDDFSLPLTLGGDVTANQVMDKVLMRMGLGRTDGSLLATNRNWHSQGDVVLPAGDPAHPFLWEKCGTTYWDTLEKIAKLVGLEIGVSRAGVYTTVPRDYFEAIASKEWKGVADGNITEGITRMSYSYDSDGNISAIIIRGREINGTRAWAFVIDEAAETDPLSSRFTPWRESIEDDVEGYTGGSLLNLAAQGLMDKMQPDFRATVEGQSRLDVLRRNKALVTGTNLGATDLDVFGVLTINVSYEADASFENVTQSTTLQRLPA